MNILLSALASGDSQFQGLCSSGLRGTGVDVTNFFRNTLPPSMQAQDIAVNLVLDVVADGRSLCEVNPLPLIGPGNSYIAYRFRVDLNRNVPQKRKTCDATGRVSFPLDDKPPLTVVRIRGAERAGVGLCGNNPSTGAPKRGVPSICVGNRADAELEVVTVRDTADCRTCLSDVYRITDRTFPITPQNSSRGTCRDPHDAIQDCVASNRCLPTDPGSQFLCRIGEKNWLNGKTGGGNMANGWAPCEQARIIDFDGSTIDASTVTIQYGGSPRGPSAVLEGVYGSAHDLTQSDTATWARIRLTDLRPGRSYQFDVRAVDSGSLFIGPSFCGVAGDACTPDSGYGVAVGVIGSPQPTLGGTRSADRSIASAVDRPTGAAGFDGILLGGFGGSQFQCRAGPFKLYNRVRSYPTDPAFNVVSGLGIELCEMTTSPATQGTTCWCNNNGVCVGEGSTPAISGNFTASFRSNDECNGQFRPSGGSFGWCQDVAGSFDISRPGPLDFGDRVTPPDAAAAAQYPASKRCGLSFGKPNFSTDRGVDTTTYNYSAAIGSGSVPGLVPGGFNPKKHSGCLSVGIYGKDFVTLNAARHNQLCIQAMDPCGRMSAKYTPGVTYGLYTGKSNSPTEATESIAMEANGSGAIRYYGGNLCEPGTYAGCPDGNGGNLCYGETTCQNFGQACHSNWDDSAYTPSHSEACVDPRNENPGRLTMGDLHGIAEKRCGTKYQCVDGKGRYPASPTCDAFKQKGCPVAGICVGAVAGSCAPYDDPGTAAIEKIDEGKSCYSGTDCASGTCSGGKMGSCRHDGSISCTEGGTCDVADDSTRCEILTQDKCKCPDHRVCPNDGRVVRNSGNPDTEDAGAVKYCQALRGACGQRDRLGKGAYCNGAGNWVNYYCGYNVNEEPAGWAKIPKGSITDKKIVIDKDGKGIDGQTCYELIVPGEKCDPTTDYVQPARPLD